MGVWGRKISKEFVLYEKHFCEMIVKLPSLLMGGRVICGTCSMIDEEFCSIYS